jgi:hypothetical protein
MADAISSWRPFICRESYAKQHYLCKDFLSGFHNNQITRAHVEAVAGVGGPGQILKRSKKTYNPYILIVPSDFGRIDPVELYP